MYAEVTMVARPQTLEYFAYLLRASSFMYAKVMMVARPQTLETLFSRLTQAAYGALALQLTFQASPVHHWTWRAPGWKQAVCAHSQYTTWCQRAQAAFPGGLTADLCVSGLKVAPVHA